MHATKLIAIFVLIPFVGLAQAPSEPDDWDEQLLKSVGISTAPADLLDFFRKRTPTDADRAKLQDAADKLGSPQYAEREYAKKELAAAGTLSLPHLTKALKNTNEEAVRYAEQLIKEIEAKVSPEQPIAAARVLARRQVAGAAQVLFDYLPHAGDAWTREEVLTSLGRIMVRPGTVDPVLLAALKDKSPERRAIAVYLLARRGDFEQRDTIRRFLADPEAIIRAHAVQGLVGKQALEVLKETVSSDQALVKTNNISLDEPSLLAELSRRTLTDAKQMEIRTLIRQLGSDSFRDRQLAHKKLIQEGTAALVFLKEAHASAELLEVSRRIEHVLEEIRRGPGPALPIAIARLLAQPREKVHSPAAAIRVLLEYVPFADDSSVEDEVLNCLCLLSVREEKVDPLLPLALQDAAAARRAAAAYVLGKVGTREQVILVRKLLDDAVPSVRLRVTQGLVAARDKTVLSARDKHGTPRIVSLIGELPPPALWQVEDLLHRLAAEKTPPDPVGETSLESRQKAARAWEKWWDANASTLDLSQADETEPRLGLTTICEYDSAIGQAGGQVWEMGPDRKVRWKIKGLLGPMEAQVLPSGRILIAENSSRSDAGGNVAGTVTERDLSGNVRWSYELKGGNPITAQRLPNGNTFIATYNQLMEITPAGKPVYTHTRGPNFYIFSAQKLRNGNIVCATAAGLIVELDSETGKEVRTINIGNNGGWCSVEAQPNGRYLVATLVGQGQVREIDIHGKVHMSFNYAGVFRCTRLPNGNFLVASMTTRKVAEFDRGGVLRWEHVCEGRPWSVRYR